MQVDQIEKLKSLSKDLRHQEPRGKKEELGGYQIAARTLDKCRAEIVGWQGEFKFNCPMDQKFFNQSGIDAQDFRHQVSTGATDAEMAEWIQQNAKG